MVQKLDVKTTPNKKKSAVKPFSKPQILKELQQREAELAIIKSVQDGLASKITVDAAGDYRITLRYVPKNWPRNLALFATGAVLLCLSLVFALRRPRSTGSLPVLADPAPPVAKSGPAHLG